MKGCANSFSALSTVHGLVSDVGKTGGMVGAFMVGEIFGEVRIRFTAGGVIATVNRKK
jgi:hypothetical protein